MLAVNVLCVGRLKEKYLKDGIAEYAKRLSRFCKFTVTEVEEEPLTSESESDIERVKAREGQRILSRAEGHLIALCIDGKNLSSTELSE